MTPEEIAALKKQNEEFQAALAAKEARAADVERRALEAEKQLADQKAAAQAAADAAEAARVAQLPAHEQLQARLNQMEAKMQADAQRFAQEQAFLKQQTDSYFLQAHKEAALRAAGPNLIMEMVGGNTPQEIDASIQRALQTYAQIQANITAEVQRAHLAQVTQATTNAVPAMPQNPALTLPPGYALPSGPTGPSPAASPDVHAAMRAQQAAPVQFQGMSAEEAVRRGLYNPQTRSQFLQQAGGVPSDSFPQQQHAAVQQRPQRQFYQPQQPGYPQPHQPQQQQPQYPQYPQQPYPQYPPQQPLVPPPFYPPQPPPPYQPPQPPQQPQYHPQQGYQPPATYAPTYQAQGPENQPQAFHPGMLAPMPGVRQGKQQSVMPDEDPGFAGQQGPVGNGYPTQQYNNVGGVGIPAGVDPNSPQVRELVAALHRTHGGQNEALGALGAVRGRTGPGQMQEVNTFMQKSGVDHAAAAAYRDAYLAGTPQVLSVTSHTKPNFTVLRDRSYLNVFRPQ